MIARLQFNLDLLLVRQVDRAVEMIEAMSGHCCYEHATAMRGLEDFGSALCLDNANNCSMYNNQKNIHESISWETRA